MTPGSAAPTARKSRLEMGPRLRKAVFVVHLAASLGWMGAMVAFIALDFTTMTREEPTVLRGAYIGLQLVTDYAVFPLATAAFWTGIVMALGTKWGLFRHWWVIATLVLTVGAASVVGVVGPVVAKHAQTARDPATTDAALQGLGHLLPYSIGMAAVLLVVTALNVYKPFGPTPYGRRKQREAQRTPEGPPDPEVKP